MLQQLYCFIHAPSYETCKAVASQNIESTVEIVDAIKKAEATLTMTNLWMRLQINYFRVSS